MKTYEEFQNAMLVEIQLSKLLHKPFNSSHEGYGVLLEEVDEVWDCIKKSKSYKLTDEAKKELIQVAAVAMRMINEL